LVELPPYGPGFCQVANVRGMKQSYPPVSEKATGYSASNSVARASFAISWCTTRR